MLCWTDLCREKSDDADESEADETDLAERGERSASGAKVEGGVRHSGREMMWEMASR